MKRVSPSERIRKDEVKLFARQISDTVSRKLQTRFAFASNTDTSILVNNFNERIAELGFSVDWVVGKREVKGFEEDEEVKEVKEDEEGEIKRGKAGKGDEVGDFIFYSSVLDNSLAAQVSHYTIYLVKRLSTNIAVAIILLLIVGTAFAISLISFKKQLQLSNMRNDFVGNITHELKTPVATVRVALEALLSYKVMDNRAKAEEYLRIASQETYRLDYLIQRVIEMAIRESEASIINPEKLCLKQMVNEVIASMQIRIAQQQAQVKVDFTGSDFSVKADSLHLQGVLNSLLDNSMNYSEQTPSIYIRLEEQPTSVLLTVSDNGIGIPEEYLKRVFDKFFRVPAGNRHNVKGYGLGLSYAASVMQQLGGTISVRNNPTGGCTFTLTFPKYSA
ncbi:MAG: HAMP domain-containing sensor histidine kinase [Tenuifilaceae bacterium]|nr:HAMP domain-containing sensor histidine kinase [Tenuifilaceae bacterium]